MDDSMMLFDVLMDAMCCVACADGKFVKLEKLAIHALAQKEHFGWSHDEVERRINTFVERVKANGWRRTTDEVCARLPRFAEIHREDVLRSCIDRVMLADGTAHPKEIALCRKFMRSCTQTPAPKAPPAQGSEATSPAGTVALQRTDGGWLLPPDRDVIPVTAQLSDGRRIEGVAEAVHRADDGSASVLNIGPLQWIDDCPVVLGKQYQATDLVELAWRTDVTVGPPPAPAAWSATWAEPTPLSTGPSYSEKDNRGTRHDTERLASLYWMGRMGSSKKDPFVLYAFDSGDAAHAALRELPCIHVAADSRKLICTEVLIFGYYATESGTYEAIVCGADLTHELWEQAKASFVRHGGRPVGRGALEPPAGAGPDRTKKPQADKVVFVREDRRDPGMVYRIHTGPDAASAQAFLEQHPVTQPLYYLVVETPEGNYCRDIMGMYKE
jgi:hypothetical protein